MSSSPTLRLFVVGAGGHGRVVAEAARALGYNVSGFFDDNKAREGDEINGVRVLGGLSAIGDAPLDAMFALGVGDNRGRLKVAQMLARQARTVATLIHPSAVISAHTVIGEGAYVGPLAVVHVNAVVGRHCIINTAAIVDHECRLEDFAHASANVIMAGQSSAGEGSLIGVGASLLPKVRVGSWSEIGAGSVVTRDLGDRIVAYGVPARVKRRVAE